MGIDRRRGRWITGAANLLLGLLPLGCANVALDRARTQLYLSRVRLHTTPFFVIEGDEVTARVPLDPNPACSLGVSVLRQDHSISLQMTGEKPCRISAQMGSTVIGMRLGVLPAGDYTLHAGALEHTFTVQPPSTPVGPVPENWRVAIAVVERFDAERCEGEPPMNVGTPPERVRRDHPLLFRQVRIAYPSLNDEYIADLIDRASYVKTLAAGDNSFHYAVKSGLCCMRECADGRARIHASGRIEFGVW